MKQQKNAVGETKKATSASDLAKMSKQKFIETAMKRWKTSADATSETRRDSLDDFKFRIGEQWDEAIKRKRGNKVSLTINRTASFCNQVTNEQRQQRPSGTVNPVGSGADVDTAEILQGMVRHIEVNCDAEVADDLAFEHMVIGGFGWLQLYSEYSDDDPDDPFAQEMKVCAIPNPFTVYDDPAARHPLKIDAKWRFIVEDMPAEEYKLQHPKSELASLEDWMSVGDKPEKWISKESIRIAEYYHIETDEKKVYQLEDGSVVDEVPDGQKAFKERTIQNPKVMWSLINAIEVLDEHEVPGKIIPSIPVLGYNLNIDGKQYLAGLVRTAKDPARAYNYHLSAATQAVAIAPKMPFIIAEGQAEGHEAEWRNANTGDLAALTYKAIDVAGRPVPPPQRETAEPPIQAITALLTTADTDMKAVTGLFDPSLGQKSPDQSGKAIVALQRQGNVATSNFSDNLARSKRELTRLMLEWIPVIYDTARIQRVIQPDGTVKHVGIYNSQSPAMAGKSPEEAQAAAQEALQEHIESGKIKKIYDIGLGKYDVTVSIGPSYQTKRQEAVASIMALVGAYPDLVHICGDLMVGQMDIPMAKEIAKRIKRTIPPNVLGDGDDADPEEQLARKDSELQQLMQQHQEMATELSQAVEVIKTKKIEQQGKIEIAMMQEETKRMQEENKLAIAEVTTKSQEAQFRMKLEQDLFIQFHGSAHEVGTQAVDHEHEGNMADQQAETAADSQASDQDHQAAMAQQAAEQPQNGAST